MTLPGYLTPTIPDRFRVGGGGSRQSMQSASSALEDKIRQEREGNRFYNQQWLGDKVATGIGMASTLGSTIYRGVDSINQANNLPTQAPQQSTDVFGRPIYNLNELVQSTSAIDPKGASGGEIGNAALSGAASGMKFGLLGALGGAAINAGTAAFLGNRRKKRETAQKRLATRNILASQKQFNQSSQYFNNQEAAQTGYGMMNDDSNRFSNFYRY